jgi:hypothetical protein
LWSFSLERSKSLSTGQLLGRHTGEEVPRLGHSLAVGEISDYRSHEWRVAHDVVLEIDRQVDETPSHGPYSSATLGMFADAP